MLSIALSSLAQGPGDGVAKTTYTSSQPFVGLAFMQKYLPTTAAIDSCDSNYCKSSSMFGEKYQGRAQLIDSGFYKSKNCALYSKVGTTKVSLSHTVCTRATSAGGDCSYSSGHAVSEGTLLYSTFAPTSDTCCKACAANPDCAGSEYSTHSSVLTEAGRAFAAAHDTHAAVETEGRRLQPEPYKGEGFGLHLVNVVASKTTGGIDVATLEGHYETNLGDMSTYVPFMDYSVQLFTTNLPAYAAAFAKDSVPMLTASWTATSSDSTAAAGTWYSIFVHVPKSQMVLEIIGTEAPAGATDATTVKLEPRVSPRNVKVMSAKSKDDLNLMYASSVSRATSNITAIDWFYTTVVKATKVHSVDSVGVSRRCYGWKSADSDVCFVQRTATKAAAAAFDVKAFETMMWSVHAAVIGSEPSVSDDKYNDNHYAVDTQVSGDYLSTYMEAHSPFPLKSTSTWGYDCTQDYLIDPTGWAIQTDLDIENQYPGCSDLAKAKALAVSAKAKAVVAEAVEAA